VNEEKADPASIEEVVDHEFAESALIDLALTHASFAHELDGSRGNERLEFLGDAVLDLVIAEQLFDAHPDWSEGELTRARAALVNKRTLAESARSLGLGAHIRLGRTERISKGAEKDSILANCFEAVIGALYLDAGLVPVEAFLQRIFGKAVEEGSVGKRLDPKTEFQEWAHAEHGVTPRYRTINDTETDDDDNRFTVEVLLGEDPVGVGIGRTKRAAERVAAQSALDSTLKALDPELKALDPTLKALDAEEKDTGG